MSALTDFGLSDPGLEWASLVKLYREHQLEAGLLLGTVNGYLNHINHAATFWRLTAPVQLTVSDAEAYLSYLDQTMGVAPGKTRSAKVLAVLDWAVEQQLMPWNAMRLARAAREDAYIRGQTYASAGSWSDDVAAYRAHLVDSRYKAGTIKNYVAAVRDLQRSLANSSPWTVTAKQFHAYYASMPLGGTAGAAVRRRNVAAFYDWAVEQGYVRSNLARLALDQRHVQRRPVPPAWETALEDFAAHLAAGHRAAGTSSVRRRHLRALAEHVSPRGPWGVTRKEVVSFLTRDGWSADTRRTWRSSICSFYRWAQREGHITVNPAEDLPSVRVPRPRPRPVPDAYVETALETVDPRLRAMILLGACAGLRACEIASLNRHDIDFGRQQIHVLGKGDVKRVVPMHPLVDQELRDWLGARNGFIFPGRYHGHLSAHYVSRLLSQALPLGWTGHTLRHRFGSVGYDATRDLRAMQELLGHASPATTAIYTAVTDQSLVDTVAAVGFGPERRGRSTRRRSAAPQRGVDAGGDAG